MLTKSFSPELDTPLYWFFMWSEVFKHYSHPDMKVTLPGKNPRPRVPGKTIANNNHAELSLGIIEKDFLLDDIDRDCILNHGTSGNPKTEEGKFFRYADGLSVFTSDLIHFQFFALGKEGLSFHEIKDNMEGIYKKYKSCYVDSPEIIKLLDESYKKNFR